MTLDLELPDDVLARIERIASARGITAEQVAADILARAAADLEQEARVRGIITEDQEILDRLAAPPEDGRS